MARRLTKDSGTARALATPAAVHHHDPAEGGGAALATCNPTPVATHGTDYATFLERKRRVWHGDAVSPVALPAQLFEWQAAITKWARVKGRAAIFADTGLGKSFMQVSWAQGIDGRVLFFAPLCVAEQTIREADRLGSVIHYCHDRHEAERHQLCITNYDRLDKFDGLDVAGVVLDESSILKSFDGKTRSKLIARFAGTRYRLCCTATPSPNDISELANHAEFLGLMTRAEFLATWFVHDDAGWRMKRHAVAPFYRWLASWAVAVRHPRDLGYEQDGYDLPPLRIHDVVIDSASVPGVLFPELSVHGLSGRLTARRGSLEARVDAVASIVASAPREQWILWCGLNVEANALADRLQGSVNVQGSDSHAEKTGAVQSFLSGEIRILISKPKILGFGLNLQCASRMVFVGLGDSYETYYQAIRRCWRYGQTRPVDVYVVVSEAETVVVENVRRKEQHASTLASELLTHMQPFEREELMSA